MHTPKRNKDARFTTIEMEQQDCNLSRGNVMKIAKEAGALIKIGRVYRIDDEIFKNHFVANYTVS